MNQSRSSQNPAEAEGQPSSSAGQPADTPQPLSKRKQRQLATRGATPLAPNEVQVVVHFVNAAAFGGTDQALDWLVSCMSEQSRTNVRSRLLTPQGNAVFWFATVEAGYQALWSLGGRVDPQGEPILPMWGFAMKTQTWQRVLDACGLPRTQPPPRRTPVDRLEAWRAELRELARKYHRQVVAERAQVVAPAADQPSTSRAAAAAESVSSGSEERFEDTSRRATTPVAASESVETLVASEDVDQAPTFSVMDEPEVFNNEEAARAADRALEQELARLNVALIPAGRLAQRPVPVRRHDTTELNPANLANAIRRITGAAASTGPVVLMAPPMLDSLYGRTALIIDDWSSARVPLSNQHTLLKDWCLRESERLEQVCRELAQAAQADEARRIIWWAWQLRMVELSRWRSSDPVVHVHRVKVALMLTRRVILSARSNDWRERYALERMEARSASYDSPQPWPQDKFERIEMIPLGVRAMLQFESTAQAAYRARDAHIFERRVREAAQQTGRPVEPVESTWREWSVTLRAKAEACHLAQVYWAWKPENDPHPPIDRSRIFVRYWALIVENMFDMLPTVMTMHFSAALDALRHFDVRANLLMRRLWQLPGQGRTSIDPWPHNLPVIPYPSSLEANQPASSGLTLRSLNEEHQLLTAEFRAGSEQVRKDAEAERSMATPTEAPVDKREALWREYKRQAEQAWQAYQNSLPGYGNVYREATRQPAIPWPKQPAASGSRESDRPSTSGSRRRPASPKQPQPPNKRQRK